MILLCVRRLRVGTLNTLNRNTKSTFEPLNEPKTWLSVDQRVHFYLYDNPRVDLINYYAVSVAWLRMRMREIWAYFVGGNWNVLLFSTEKKKLLLAKRKVG